MSEPLSVRIFNDGKEREDSWEAEVPLQDLYGFGATEEEARAVLAAKTAALIEQLRVLTRAAPPAS